MGIERSVSVQEILKQHETCYLYNETFRHYHDTPLPRHECEQLLNDWNQCKGGHWIIRRKVDYQEDFKLRTWYKTCDRVSKPAGVMRTA